MIWSNSYSKKLWDTKGNSDSSYEETGPNKMMSRVSHYAAKQLRLTMKSIRKYNGPAGPPVMNGGIRQWSDISNWSRGLY